MKDKKAPLRVVYNPVPIGADGQKLLSPAYMDFAIAFVDPQAKFSSEVKAAAKGLNSEQFAVVFDNALSMLHSGAIEKEGLRDLVNDIGLRENELIDEHKAAADETQRLYTVKRYVEEGKERLKESPEAILAALPEYNEQQSQKFKSRLSSTLIRARKSMYQPPHLRAGLEQELRELQHITDFAIDGPKYASQREKVESFIGEAYAELPISYRANLSAQAPTIAVMDSMHYYAKALGAASPKSNAIFIDGYTLENDPEQSKKVFFEEVVHLLDKSIGFTDRAEWKAAAKEQLEHMDTASEALKAAHGGKKGQYGDKSYDNFDKQSVELLADYFHVRNHLHAEREKLGQPPSVEAVREQMQQLFPHVHELCESFEAELTRRAAALSRGHTP